LKQFRQIDNKIEKQKKSKQLLGKAKRKVKELIEKN
jgi:hypothetical protein